MKTVKEVSRLSGVSVRTLHHYDSIGLLKPSGKTPAGYRLYDDKALARLQMILLYRELEFSLSEIGEILDASDFNRRGAIRGQIALLEQRKKQIEELIFTAKKMLREQTEMDFSAFDKSQEEALRREAKERWGSTKAYAQYAAKGDGTSTEEVKSKALMEKFAQMGKLKHFDPAEDEVQNAVKELQEYITANYYECTKPILLCLGEMYVGDERFCTTIDAAGGEGTANFVRKAILIYCR